MLKIKIFLDTADLKVIKKNINNKEISGFTTNPTLISKNNINNYLQFAKEITQITNKPLSLEVFSDDFKKMETEAKILSKISDNIFVKIPIVNSKGKSSAPLIKKLLEDKMKLNITAIFTINQLIRLKKIIKKNDQVILSVFCGRIMDSGIYPDKISKFAKTVFKNFKKVQLLWASTREIYNLIQAKKLNYDIITIAPDILSKKKFFNYNQEKFSIDTVKSFLNDAKKSKLKII
jgi:transaldolase